MKIGIIDYGAGNLSSVKNAFNKLKIPSVVSSEPQILTACDKLILPGVGAYPDAMSALSEKNLIEPIKEMVKTTPLLGICLGMQLLFEKSYEFCECDGLGLISGYVNKIEFDNLKIPHMGWNDLNFLTPCPLLRSTSLKSYVYFVHSYKAVCDDKYIAAYTTYGQRIPALVCRDNIFGVQFHPEKSGDVGLNILKEFVNL